MKINATEDGESRFIELDIPLEHVQQDAFGNTVGFSNGYVSPNVRFVELPEGLAQGWHCVSTRRVVNFHSGVLEVGTSDMQTRQWRAGGVFLADDVTGKGHKTREVEGSVHLVFIPLPPNFDVQRWSA